MAEHKGKNAPSIHQRFVTDGNESHGSSFLSLLARRQSATLIFLNQRTIIVGLQRCHQDQNESPKVDVLYFLFRDRRRVQGETLDGAHYYADQWGEAKDVLKHAVQSWSIRWNEEKSARGYGLVMIRVSQQRTRNATIQKRCTNQILLYDTCMWKRENRWFLSSFDCRALTQSFEPLGNEDSVNWVFNIKVLVESKYVCRWAPLFPSYCCSLGRARDIESSMWERWWIWEGSQSGWHLIQLIQQLSWKRSPLCRVVILSEENDKWSIFSDIDIDMTKWSAWIILQMFGKCFLFSLIISPTYDALRVALFASSL